MSNETFGDLMAEYEKHRENAKRFSHWGDLDKFMRELANRIAPKKEEPLPRFTQYAFDDMGTALPHDEPTYIAFDPIDGKRIE